MSPCLIFCLIGLWLPVLTTAVNGTDGGQWVPFVEGSFDDENDNIAPRWTYGPIGFDDAHFNLAVSSATAMPPLKPSIDQSETEIISSKDDGTDQFLTEIDSFRAKRAALAGIFDDDWSRSRSSSSRSSESYWSSQSRDSSRSRSSWSSSWANERSRSAYYGGYPQQYNYGGYYARPYYNYRPQYNYGYQYRPQYRPQYHYGGHRRYYYHG